MFCLLCMDRLRNVYWFVLRFNFSIGYVASNVNVSIIS
jgi:hypothetical protein